MTKKITNCTRSKKCNLLFIVKLKLLTVCCFLFVTALSQNSRSANGIPGRSLSTTVIDFELLTGNLATWDGFEWVAANTTGTTNGYSFKTADGALRITNQAGVGNTTKRLFKYEWTPGPLQMTKADNGSFKLQSFTATRHSWLGTIDFSVKGFNGAVQVYSESFTVSGTSTTNITCTLSAANSNIDVTRIEFVTTPNGSGNIPEGNPNLDDITVINGTSNNIPVTGIVVNGPATVNVNATIQLSATVSPANATNGEVTWSSDATGLATVNSTGLVTGIAAGTVTIRATAKDGSGVVGTKSILVKTSTPVTGIAVNGASSVSVGATSYYSVFVSPSDASNAAVTWSSDAAGIATVNSEGMVTAISAGTTTIRATAQDGSGVVGTKTITITNSSPLQGARISQVGINLGNEHRDYSSGKAYADAIRSSRQWNTLFDRNGGGAESWTATVDADYWPTTDATLLVWAGLKTNNNSGRYKLSFTGSATVQAVGAVIQNYAYDAASNRSTADVVINDAANETLYLDFISTKRTGTSALNTGITNVKLMRPLTAGDFTNSYPETQLYTTPFLNAVAPFKVLRYIKWMELDYPPAGDSLWANRTKWAASTQIPKNDLNPTNEYLGWARTPSWESVIKLANATNSDPWITIPARVDDDYLIQLATLFRDGNADCEPLNPNLKIYVEYGNEIWNSGTYWRVWNYVKQKGMQSPICTFDGETDQNTLAWRWQAKRSVDISNIFRQVFGETAFSNRIRPLVTGQLVANDGNLRILDFIDRYYNKADSRSAIATPHPLNYFFYGYGTSTYFNVPENINPANGLTINNIWNYFDTDRHYNELKSQVSLAKMYGLKFVPYEGGPHPNYNGDEVITRQAVVDTRMRQKQVDMHKEFHKAGGDDLLVYFSLSDPDLPASPSIYDGQFGLIRGDLANTNWPRYNAMLDIKNLTPLPITNGSLVPFVRDGKNYNIKSGDGILFQGPGATTLTANSLTHSSGYNFYVNSTGNCNLRIEYSTVQPGAIMLVEVDGVVLGSFTLANTNGVAAFTPFMNLLVEAGRLHSVRVVCIGNSGVSLNVVRVHMALGQVTAVTDVVNAAGTSIVAVYPNPTKGQVILKIANAKSGTAMFRIFNTEGRLIKSETRNIVSGNSNILLNVTDVPSGIYILTVTSKTGVTNHKIIKQ